MRLAEKPFRVLLILVEGGGELATREELQKKLWPGDTVVDFEHGINTAIKVLRRALGDSADEPRYIETIPRRGYRLMVPVEWIRNPDDGLSGKDGVAAGVQIDTAGLIGKKVSHYRVLGVIGGGGMGLVFKAEDLKLGRQVALKFLPEELACDPAALQRFEREARTASSLDHPNICTIYEVEEHEEQPFLVMQLLEGETLRDRLARASAAHTPLPFDEALDIALQVSAGLEAAHQKGIIHRDIKPANIFLTSSGQVKIVDFGLAKLVTGSKELGSDGLCLEPAGRDTPQSTRPAAVDETITRLGTAMGTAGYMSPEQVRGEKLDARTDLFSFGLVLYEMFTGQRAFSGDTAAIVQDAILNNSPVPLRELNSTLPAKLVSTIDKALEKDRAWRFQSTSDLAFALNTLAENSENAVAYSRTSPPRSRLFTLVSEHQLVLTTGLLLIVALVGVLLYSTRDLRSSNVPHTKITHHQFTSLGYAYEPALSPDGLFVAYVSRKFGEPQKLMVRASTGTEVELVRSSYIAFPRWSPDGSEVLFTSYEHPPNDAELAAKIRSISVVSRLGGIVRPIFAGLHACWLTADGSQIVTANESEPKGKGLRLVNRPTGEVRDINQSDYGFVDDIDCSPRASLILEVTDTSNKNHIRTLKPDGSEERELAAGSDEIYSARWSPSGDAIYYLHKTGNTNELSRISATRGDADPEVLADGLQTGTFFTLSGDGSQLAYTREENTSNLWRVDLRIAKTSAKPEIGRLTSGTSYHSAPSFSPDGRWISFALGINYSETNIFKMEATGGELIQLTFFEHAWTESPAWSPDGQRIAFISTQNGPPRVWTIGANGGVPKAIANTDASDAAGKVSWWPGSDIVYQQSRMRNFLRIDTRTQEEIPLIPQGESVGTLFPHKPVFSPDGKKMAFFWNQKRKGLWMISLNPYAETFLLPGIINPFGWSPDGKYVYAIRSGTVGEGREIVKVQLSNPNEVTSVATLPGDVVNFDGATVSPDGHEAIVSVREDKSDVWLMKTSESPRK